MPSETKTGKSREKSDPSKPGRNGFDDEYVNQRRADHARFKHNHNNNAKPDQVPIQTHGDWNNLRNGQNKHGDTF